MDHESDKPAKVVSEPKVTFVTDKPKHSLKTASKTRKSEYINFTKDIRRSSTALGRWEPDSSNLLVKHTTNRLFEMNNITLGEPDTLSSGQKDIINLTQAMKEDRRTARSYLQNPRQRLVEQERQCAVF